MATGKRPSTTSDSKDPAKPSQGWRFVQPDEILTYRREHGLSRAKLAEALGVSTTSIQNWESGRVATLATQRRLRSLIDGDPLPTNGASPHAPAGESAQDSLVMMTGQIVSAYLANQPDLDPSKIPDLIRTVKAALRS